MQTKMGIRLKPRQWLWAWLFAPALASAAPKRDFDNAYQAGQDAFNLGRYDDARAHFEQARALEPNLPGPYRWLGRIARTLEQWEECIARSTEAARLRPSSPHLPEVRKDLDTCRAALGRPGYGQRFAVGQGGLAILSDDGLEVAVDGIAKGVTPILPIPLQAGRHRVRVGGAALTIEVVPGIVVDALVPHLTL